jgi:hypothetical protein
VHAYQSIKLPFVPFVQLTVDKLGKIKEISYDTDSTSFCAVLEEHTLQVPQHYEDNESNLLSWLTTMLCVQWKTGKVQIYQNALPYKELRLHNGRIQEKFDC